MLKIVDCASAVCAAITNIRATTNPERTLKLFTVFSPPFFFTAKKNAQLHHSRCDWTSLSPEIFLPHSAVRPDKFVARDVRGCQLNTSRTRPVTVAGTRAKDPRR